MMLDDEKIRDNTFWSARRMEKFLERARRAGTDADAKERRARRWCAPCFYALGPGVAGRAFTEYLCADCGKRNSHPDTNVPKVCSPCSDARGLCARCAGLLEPPEAP